MNMEKFQADVYELFRSSTLIQGTMALGCTFTIAYLYLTGKVVPDSLVGIVMLILGYYFGTKTTQRNQQEMMNNVAERVARINAGTDSVN